MGCGQGAVEVVLTAPSAESARPVGATQVALRAVASDGEVITRSAAIVDGAFDLGALPIADYLGMTVELRDDVGGQVGFGRSTATLEVQDDGTVVYPIPVRRPRLYLGGHAAGIRTTDPLDGAIAKTIQLDRGDRDVAFATRSFAPSAAMAARDRWPAPRSHGAWSGHLRDRRYSTITRSLAPRPKVSGMYISSALVGGTTNVPGVVARAT